MQGQRQSPIAVAAEAVGLLAGAVAAIYVLGGVILGIRLLFDGFGVESVVALLGQLPREFVITTALVEGVAPALLLGVVVALGYGLTNRPKSRRENDLRDDSLNSGNGWPLLFVLFAALTAALIAPAVVLAATTDGVSLRLLYSLLGAAVTYAVVCAGWFLLRRIGRRSDWYRLTRALVGGLVWAAMALVPAVMFGGASVFDHAEVCVADSADPERGSLIALTNERILLAQDAGDRQTIVAVPGERVTRVAFGDLDGDACPPPEAAMGPGEA